jgi:hypothetical protein
MPLQPGTLWAKLRNLKSPMKPPLWLLLAAFASIAVCEQRQGDLDRYSDNARQALTAHWRAPRDLEPAGRGHGNTAEHSRRDCIRTNPGRRLAVCAISSEKGALVSSARAASSVAESVDAEY